MAGKSLSSLISLSSLSYLINVMIFTFISIVLLLSIPSFTVSQSSFSSSTFPDSDNSSSSSPSPPPSPSLPLCFSSGLGSTVSTYATSCVFPSNITEFSPCGSIVTWLIPDDLNETLSLQNVYSYLSSSPPSSSCLFYDRLLYQCMKFFPPCYFYSDGSGHLIESVQRICTNVCYMAQSDNNNQCGNTFPQSYFDNECQNNCFYSSDPQHCWQPTFSLSTVPITDNTVVNQITVAVLLSFVSFILLLSLSVKIYRHMKSTREERDGGGGSYGFGKDGSHGGKKGTNQSSSDFMFNEGEGDEEKDENENEGEVERDEENEKMMKKTNRHSNDSDHVGESTHSPQATSHSHDILSKKPKTKKPGLRFTRHYSLSLSEKKENENENSNILPNQKEQRTMPQKGIYRSESAAEVGGRDQFNNNKNNKNNIATDSNDNDMEIPMATLMRASTVPTGGFHNKTKNDNNVDENDNADEPDSDYNADLTLTTSSILSPSDDSQRLRDEMKFNSDLKVMEMEGNKLQKQKSESESQVETQSKSKGKEEEGKKGNYNNKIDIVIDTLGKDKDKSKDKEKKKEKDKETKNKMKSKSKDTDVSLSSSSTVTMAKSKTSL